MSDTRKEFEQAMKNKLGADTPSFKRYGKPAQDQYIIPDLQAAWTGWQACQQLNDKRIADLLAVIELQRQALMPLADMAAHFPTDGTFGNRPTTGDIYGCVDKYGEHSITVEHLQSAVKAIAFTVDDVELVEVGVVACQTGKWYGRISTQALITKSVIATEKLYAIKQKSINKLSVNEDKEQ